MADLQAGRITTHWRLAMLAPLALMTAAASGDSVPQVILATPGSEAAGDAAINRFTLRFSEAMVPLGDPRAPAPATHDCPVPGKGRWVDPQTWVLEFDSAIPAGNACDVTLNERLLTQRGAAITGTRSFPIDTGGPSVRAVLAGGSYSGIEEDQIFLIATNAAPDRASVARNGYCAVDGIGEKIPLDLLPATTASEILTGLGNNNWERQDFLSAAGLPTQVPAAGSDQSAFLSRIIAAKCRRPLPPGRDMALVWDARIAQAGAPTRTAARDQRFDYSVRAAFTARVSCSRVSAQAGCNPLRPVTLSFTAPVARATALAATLRLADGSIRNPDRPSDNDAFLTTVSFGGPLPEAQNASLILPADLADQSGRLLQNAARFPQAVAIDRTPPIVKFAAPFGILEAREGGVLPVTVRGVEPELQREQLSIPGATLRVGDDDAAILQWLDRVENADDSDVREEPDGKGGTRQVNYTGTKSIFAALPAGTPARSALALPLPGKGKEFEVVGIPLTEPGFHVVELASPELGAALLGRKGTRYVASAALVTNMAVHFKWGRAASLAWVTSLDTGLPLAGAEVRVTDACTGRSLARGITDAQGRLVIASGLPKPETYSDCPEDPRDAVGSEGHALMVSARAGDDFSFTLTDWGDGLRPYDFDLPFGWAERTDILHSIFDRALVKAGESVSMKHILRRPVGIGFAFAPTLAGTLRLAHRGSDTSFELPFAIDAGGVGENVWNVPAAAPMGDYDLQFVTKDAKGEERTIWSNQSVRVDEYRLPTMRATVTGPKDAPVRPAAVPLSLFAGYLSGGPASGLPVTIRTAFYQSWSAPEDYDGWDFGGMPVA